MALAVVSLAASMAKRKQPDRNRAAAAASIVRALQQAARAAPPAAPMPAVPPQMALQRVALTPTSAAPGLLGAPRGLLGGSGVDPNAGGMGWGGPRR